MGIICQLGYLYLLVIFVRILFSWIPMEPDSGLSTLHGYLLTVTEPVLAPVRNLFGPVRFGGAAIDLSPIVVIIGIQILLRAIC